MAFEELNMEHTGLMFFGQVSASISHEIKNALAIINENAGLLEDLVMMSAKGVPPDIGRLSRVGETVRKQVQRADDIVKKMNRFAHSADDGVEKVDLYETTCFIADLCGRMIKMGGVSITTVPPPEPVDIYTHRFHLQNVLWVCMASLAKASRPDTEIQIDFESSAQGAVVRFRVEPAPGNGVLEALFAGDSKALRDYLGIQPLSGLSSGAIGIRLPEHIQH